MRADIKEIEYAFDIFNAYAEFENYSIVLRLLLPQVSAGMHEHITGFANGHDDPQNFSLAEWSASLSRLYAALRQADTGQ